MPCAGSRRAVSIALALLVVARSASAAADEPQGPPAPPSSSLVHGTRVRVKTTRQGRLVGYVAELRDDVLVLDRRRNGEVERLSLARRDIRVLEVSERESRRGRGALIGGLVGAVGGVALGLAGGDDSCSDDPGAATWINFNEKLSSSLCVGKGEGAFLASLVLVPLGAALGAAASPGEKWRKIGASPLSVRATITRGGGAAVRVSLRF